MGRLIYSAITSLDGYTEDATGDFQWSAPDEEVHQFVNDLTRPVGTHLLGRKMHETMVYWDTDDPDWSAIETDFAAIWQAADKIVYSRSARRFDPDEVRELKASTGHDLSIGGPELAAQAISAGLVDEYQQFLNPVIVGGGKHFLPQEVRIGLELIEERRFGNGVVFLRYAADQFPLTKR